MMRTAYLALIIVAAIAAGLYAGSDAAQAHTAPSGSFGTITILEDRWLNWDFRSNSSTASSNVDWPVTVVYYNNAKIDKVKDALKAVGNIGNSGTGEYARLDEGSGWLWAADSGLKDTCGTSEPIATHMRLYADGNGTLYNLFLSYYVIGTSHVEDCHEHSILWWSWCDHHWVGYSESANGTWDFYSDQVPGWDVYPDASDLSNCASFIDLHGSGEDHYVINDGNATLVVVP